MKVLVKIKCQDVYNALSSREFPILRMYCEGLKLLNDGYILCEGESEDGTTIKSWIDDTNLGRILSDYSFNEVQSCVGFDENDMPLYIDGEATYFFKKIPAVRISELKIILAY